MKFLMAANWKMYKTRKEAETTAASLLARIDIMPDDRELVVFAPFTAIDATLKGFSPDGTPAKGFAVGGQDVYPATEGAYTGEISPAMLLDCGASWVLTGHSERRSILEESSSLVGQKTAFAMNSGLRVTLCIGETLAEREGGKLSAVLSEQLEQGLKDLPNFNSQDLAIAYEPVWAIGTGKVAGPLEIVEAHALIRSLLTKHFPDKANELRILYGGSVKPENAAQIITLDNVDGVLVGGASLQAESFAKIALAKYSS